MKNILLACLCLGLTACDFLKKKEAPVTQETTTTAKPNECAFLGTSGEPPLAVWQMKNGQDLFVCNHNTTSKEAEDHFVGWVNLYAKIDGKMVPFIPEVDSELPSEIYHISIQKKSDKEIVIHQQISTSGEATWRPDAEATELKIDCANGDCKKGNVTCALKKNPDLVDHASVTLAEDIVAGKAKTPEFYDRTILNVAKAAVFGDERAQKLMLGTSAKKLKVDAASGEVFEDGKNFLTQLKKLNCL